MQLSKTQLTQEFNFVIQNVFERQDSLINRSYKLVILLAVETGPAGNSKVTSKGCASLILKIV